MSIVIRVNSVILRVGFLAQICLLKSLSGGEMAHFSGVIECLLQSAIVSECELNIAIMLSPAGSLSRRKTIGLLCDLLSHFTLVDISDLRMDCFGAYILFRNPLQK